MPKNENRPQRVCSLVYTTTLYCEFIFEASTNLLTSIRKTSDGGIRRPVAPCTVITFIAEAYFVECTGRDIPSINGVIILTGFQINGLTPNSIWQIRSVYHLLVIRCIRIQIHINERTIIVRSDRRCRRGTTCSFLYIFSNFGDCRYFRLLT